MAFATPRHLLLAHAFFPFVAGVLLGGVVATRGDAVASAVTVGGSVGVLALALGRAAGRTRIVLAALAVGTGGVVIATVARLGALAPDHIARQASRGTIAVEGTLVASERAGGKLRLTLRAERHRGARGRGPATGLLGVTVAHPRRTWPVGARVRVVGLLRTPRNFCNPGGYDFERALARRGVFVTMFLWDDGAIDLLAPPSGGFFTALATIRARMDARIGAAADEPARGFMAAVLLGEGGAVDRELRWTLARTGLAHVVSVSGFHVAVVAGAGIVGARWLLGRSAWLLLRWNASKVAALAGLLPVLVYAGIAGGSVPASRAVLMYAGLLAALLLDRPADALRSLAAAALVLAIGVPDVAADISFELSFVSVAALVLAARWVGLVSRGVMSAGATTTGVAEMRGRTRVPAGLGTLAVLARRAAAQLVVQPLGVTIAAVAATAPLTAWHFQQVSLIAPLANILALPLLGPATLLPGLAALPFLAAAPWLADTLLGLAAGAADLGLRLAVGLAAIPGAALATPMPSAFEICLCYAMLALPLVPARVERRPEERRRQERRQEEGSLASANIPAWRPRCALAWALLIAATADVGYWIWERTGNPNLRVTYLSVGHGDAAVVELPRGGVIVIDGGGFPGDFDTGERLIAPFLRSRKILSVEALVLSHPNLDHYGGLAHLAEHFAPREFWSNGMSSAGTSFARLERALDRAGTRRRVLRRGVPPLTLGSVRIEVLGPGARPGDDANSGGLVLRLSHGTASFLFTGDIEQRAEADLVDAASPLASAVIKVAHHGSATSTSPALLAAVAPRVAVISVGADSRFGLPAPEVVERLDAAGAGVWRTDRDGAVRIESDGTRLAVSAFCSQRRWHSGDLKSSDSFGSCS